MNMVILVIITSSIGLIMLIRGIIGIYERFKKGDSKIDYITNIFGGIVSIVVALVLKNYI